MRHIITATPGIAVAQASTFTLHPQITAIGTADRDTSIIGITIGIVIGKAAQSPSEPPKALHAAPGLSREDRQRF